MLRPALLALALAAVPAFPVLAQDSPTSQEAGIRAKLRDTVVTLDFAGTTLPELARFIAKLTALNITIDPQVLQRAEDEGFRVTLALREVPAALGLDLACKSLQLSWTVRHGVIVIVDPENHWTDVTQVVYDVRDLLVHARDHRARFHDLFGALTDVPSREFNDTENDTGMYPDELIERIRDTATPEVWDGPRASISLLGQTMVIVAPKHTHAAITSFLQDLRGMRNTRVACELTVVTIDAAAARALRASMTSAGVLSADGEMLLKTALRDGKATLESRSSISGYNAQQVALRDGTQHRIELPTGLKKPQAVVQDGLTAELRPVLVPGQQRVHLRARVQFAGRARVTTESAVMDVLTIDTAVVGPLGASIVLGGGSVGASPGEKETASTTLVLMRVSTPGEPPMPASRGTGAAAHTEPGAALAQTLGATPVTLDFADAPLVDVAGFLRDQAGVNLVIGAQVFDEIPEDALRVNLQVSDVSALQVLQLIADMLNLRLTIEAQHVLLDIRRRDTPAAYAVYDLRDLRQPAVEALAHAPDLTVVPGDRGPELDGGERPEPFSTDQFADLIRAALDPESWDTPPNSLEATPDMLFARNERATLRGVEQLLTTLRATKHRTVLAEAMVLDVTEEEWEKRKLGRVLTPAQTDTVVAAAARGEGMRIVASGRVAGPNGERFSVHAGRQIASFREAGTLFAADGVVVQIHPVESADGTVVHCALALRRHIATRHAALAPGLPAQTVRTHVKVPVAGAVVLGGFAVPGRAGSLIVLRVTPVR